MKTTSKKEKTRRTTLRNHTRAHIICKPYTSGGIFRKVEGVMRNFSRNGSYIETSHPFKSGTILILRMEQYPSVPASVDSDQWPRSFCLAEVKWQQAMGDKETTRYGMGVRYLD
ncbi:hypothetical protein DSCW_15200 [Desulfosarcina widdelii]|uniref:PilZ domain-containing protein n=1 Tax=Desulfosarcina widdelii TaxID=947919 RepID=A0A5K7Z1Y0_9BACT|nr:PilZ domain-containing protein [Desulfosarcina widdelii]BBO74103.1 hypothetical protein DSCW_15200 [Desulfosarcina widdelii]